MNVFLINHYAGSPKTGMEYRPYYLSKEWVDMGHDVSIIAGSYSHLRKIQPIGKQKLSVEMVDGIRYIWIKTPVYSGNSIGRILNMIIFTFRLRKYARKLSEKFKPNIVISSSTYPLDIFPSKKIASLSGSKLIYEIHDLWPLSPMEIGGFSKYHPFIMLMQYAENKAYKSVDAVVSILPKTLDHTVEHGLDKMKWFHIPNGIIIDEFSESDKIPIAFSEMLNGIKEKYGFIIGYTGGHSHSNALHTLIEAGKILKNDKVAFVLVGEGIEKKNLIESAKNYENIFFLDSINKNQIPNLLSYFDVCTVGSIDSPLYRFGVSPNKIFDYMLAGVPIVQYINAGNDLVEDAQCGISVNSNDEKLLSEAFLQMKNSSKSELINMGSNGKKYVIKNHDYKVLARQFIEIFNHI